VVSGKLRWLVVVTCKKFSLIDVGTLECLNQ
jgi:hypothetical protein